MIQNSSTQIDDESFRNLIPELIYTTITEDINEHYKSVTNIRTTIQGLNDGTEIQKIVDSIDPTKPIDMNEFTRKYPQNIKLHKAIVKVRERRKWIINGIIRP